MIDLTRRHYIGSVAALAATHWESEGYEIENVENQDSLAHSEVITGKISPKDVTASADGKYGGVMFSDDDFTERVVQVRYCSDGVSLDIEAKGEESVRSGLLAGLTTDQARELAAILYQAAEELDRRREVSDADE